MGNKELSIPDGMHADQVQAVVDMLRTKGTNFELEELKGAGFTKGDFRSERIRQYVNRQYNFVRVRGVGEEGQIYYQPLDNNLNPTQSYRALTDVDANNIVRSTYMQLFGMAPADKVKTAIEDRKSVV